MAEKRWRPTKISRRSKAATAMLAAAVSTVVPLKAAAYDSVLQSGIFDWVTAARTGRADVWFLGDSIAGSFDGGFSSALSKTVGIAGTGLHNDYGGGAGSYAITPPYPLGADNWDESISAVPVNRQDYVPSFEEPVTAGATPAKFYSAFIAGNQLNPQAAYDWNIYSASPAGGGSMQAQQTVNSVVVQTSAPIATSTPATGLQHSVFHFNAISGFDGQLVDTQLVNTTNTSILYSRMLETGATGATVTTWSYGGHTAYQLYNDKILGGPTSQAGRAQYLTALTDGGSGKLMVTLEEGTNDGNSNMADVPSIHGILPGNSPAAFADNITSTIDEIKSDWLAAGKPAADLSFLVLGMYDYGHRSSDELALHVAYSAQLQQVAESRSDVSFIDLHDIAPSWADANALGYMADDVHATALGASVYSDAIMSQLMPPVSLDPLMLGVGAGSSEFYTVTATAKLTSQNDQIGILGTGTVNQIGGANTISGTLWMGSNAGSVGIYNMAGGTLSAAIEKLGNQGSGTFNQVNGQNLVGSLYLGFGTGSTGTYNASNSATLTVSGDANVGVSGSGVFNQTGGSSVVSVAGTLSISSTSSAGVGTYNLQSGTLTASAVVLNAHGMFNQTGGTLNATRFTQSGGTVTGSLQNQGIFTYNSGAFTGQLVNQGTVVLNADFTAGNGLYHVSATPLTIPAGRSVTLNGAGLLNDGVINLAGNFTSSNEVIGVTGSGSFNQTGGTHTVAGLLTISPGTNHSYTLAGGVLNANVANSGNFAFVGGTFNGNFTNAAGVTALQGAFSIGASSTFNLAGGTLNAPSPSALAALPHFTWSGGAVNLSSGNLNVDSTALSPLGSTVTVGPGQLLNVTGAIYLGGSSASAGAGGTLNISGGSVAASSTLKLWNIGNTALNLSAGSLTVPTIDTSSASARLNWTGGILHLTGAGFSAGTGGLFGSTVLLGPNKTLLVDQVTTIDPSATITISGGMLDTGSITGGGTIILNSGELKLNHSDVSAGTSGFLGTSLVLGNGAALAVGQTTRIDPNASITLAGGQLTTAAIATSGSLVLNSGTFRLTNSDLLVGSGGLFGINLDVNRGMNITIDHAVTIMPGAQISSTGGNLTAGSLVNNSAISTIGGNITAIGASTNTATGQINSIGGTLNFGTGSAALINAGQITLINTTVNGDITSQPGSGITVSGTNTFNGSLTGTRVNLSNNGTTTFTGPSATIGTLSGTGNLVVGGAGGSAVVSVNSLTQSSVTVSGSTLNIGTVTGAPIPWGSNPGGFTPYPTITPGATIGSLTITNNAVVAFATTVGSGNPYSLPFTGTFPTNRITHQIGTLNLPYTTGGSANAFRSGGDFTGTINAQGTLDIGNHQVLLNTPTAQSVKDVQMLVAAGYNASNFGAEDGQWDGNGITSSVAKSGFDPNVGISKFAVGYAYGGDASTQAEQGGGADNTNTSLDGVGLNQTIVRAVLVGDVNMDGVVDFSDIASILGYHYNDGQPAHYTDGDINNHGIVDFSDIALVLGYNYHSGQSFPVQTAAQAQAKASAFKVAAASVRRASSAPAAAVAGQPNFTYDPATGDLKFVLNGYQPLGAAGAPSFISALSIYSTNGLLISSDASSTFQQGLGATLSTTLLEAGLASGSGFGDGASVTSFDLGNVLPTGLSVSDVQSDLTLKYEVMNGGRALQSTGLTGAVPEPATATVLLFGAGALLSRRRRIS